MADDLYGIGATSKDVKIKAPELDYKPRTDFSYKPDIALVGCGGISEQHLKAYKKMGLNVAVLCDVNLDNAKKAQKEFYPNAKIISDFNKILKMDNIEVADLAAHPEVRAVMFEKFIEAGKHILSQKPFVRDINFGKKIIELSNKKGVKIAVNQNGRWAPHFRYMTKAIEKGLAGDVIACHFSVTWNHNWIAGSHFEDMKYAILFDFGIHWFDILNVFMNNKKPLRIYASAARAKGQHVKPPFLSQVSFEYEDAQASISFDADSKFGQEDRTIIVGTKGMLKSEGPDLMNQQVDIFLENGIARPKLDGLWFPDGFQGTMAELLYSIENKCEPYNGAENNLGSLQLAFAAIESAESGKVLVPGKDGLKLIG
jgi:predicted dehydrogenase